MDRRPAGVVLLLVLVLALGLGLVTAPGDAATPPGRIARAAAVAERVFHSRCAGAIRVRFGVREDNWRGVTLATARWHDPHRSGVPYTDCEIILNRRELASSRRVPFEVFCSLLLHEYGHLAGRRHSRNPRSVMYPVNHVDPRCRAAAGRSGG